MLTATQLHIIGSVLEVHIGKSHPITLAVDAEKQALARPVRTGPERPEMVESDTQLKTGPAGNRTLTTTTSKESNDGCF